MRYQYYNHWADRDSQLYSIYISCDHPSHISYRSCKHVCDEMRLRKICILADCILYCGQHLQRLLLGICDANMVLITCNSYRHLVQDGTFLLTVNESPVITLLYYVLPRSFLQRFVFNICATK